MRLEVYDLVVAAGWANLAAGLFAKNHKFVESPRATSSRVNYLEYQRASIAAYIWRCIIMKLIDDLVLEFAFLNLCLWSISDNNN